MEKSKIKGCALVHSTALSLFFSLAVIPGGIEAAWTDIGPAGPVINNFDLHSPAAATTVYSTSQSGGNEGVWKLPTSGPPWVQQDAPSAYTSVAVDPNDPDKAVAGVAGGGIKYTTDGGNNWQDSAGETNHANRVFSYAASNSSIVYAGGWTPPSGELLVSVDGGINWTSIPVAGDAAPEVVSIAVDPTDSNVVFASLKLDNNQKGIFRTSNGGVSWEFKSNYTKTTAFAITIDPNDSGIIYAGTDGAPEVFRSTDNGDTWTNLNTPAVSQFNSVRTIAVNPADSRIIYAGGNQLTRVIASKDCGKTWTAVAANEVLGGPKKLVYDGSSNLVYAVAASGGIYTNPGLTAPSDACPASSSGSGSSSGGDSGGGSSFGYYLLGFMQLMLIIRLIRASKIENRIKNILSA